MERKIIDKGELLCVLWVSYCLVFKGVRDELSVVFVLLVYFGGGGLCLFFLGCQRFLGYVRGLRFIIWVYIEVKIIRKLFWQLYGQGLREKEMFFVVFWIQRWFGDLVNVDYYFYYIVFVIFFLLFVLLLFFFWFYVYNLVRQVCYYVYRDFLQEKVLCQVNLQIVGLGQGF